MFYCVEVQFIHYEEGEVSKKIYLTDESVSMSHQM